MGYSKAEYAELLLDPRWQKVRLEVLRAAHWRCQCCCADNTTLEVHHLDYLGEPWSVPRSWLECLCSDCHVWRENWNAIHGRSLQSTRSLKYASSIAAGGLDTRAAGVRRARQMNFARMGRAEYKRFRKQQRAMQRLVMGVEVQR